MGIFRQWVEDKFQESSPFTRRRRAAAFGLAPPIPDAAINSRSTAMPWEKESIEKQNREGERKHKKKKHKKKEKDCGCG